MSIFQTSAYSKQQRYILKKRILEAIRKRMREYQNEYVQDLEKKNEELMNEIDLVSDEGTMELRREFEGMKNLVKYLMYRSGYDDEDSPIRLNAHAVADMMDVEMRHWWDEDENDVVIELEEYNHE